MFITDDGGPGPARVALLTWAPPPLNLVMCCQGSACRMTRDPRRLDGSLMTKAISIETAALAWLPADGPENLELRRSLPDRRGTNGSDIDRWILTGATSF